MSKDNVGLSWFSRMSRQHVLEINARMEAFEYEARESANRTLEVSGQILELQARGDEDAAEIEKLKSDVARLERQLAWTALEAHKTGVALLERIETLKKYIDAANQSCEPR